MRYFTVCCRRDELERGDTMKYLTLFLIIIIYSCVTPTFAVKEADNRFNENKDSLYYAENNRISSRSISGGIHFDSKGVYINPYVCKDRNTGKIWILGLEIINKTDFTTTGGRINQLGYITKIVFRFSDGSLLELHGRDQENTESDFIYYNSITHSASFDKQETGIADITKAQFKRLSAAKQISCKIYGTEQSTTYEAKDIFPAFTINLKQFYQTYVE